MEPLIIEIKTAGLCRYYSLSKDVIRIGRALDNDIILSDLTVEPHHLKITRNDDGETELENLASVNPASFNRQPKDGPTILTPPIEITMGRISALILSPDHPVEATKPLASGGQFSHLFSHAGWCVLLLSLCFIANGLEYYLTSFQVLDWTELTKYVFQESGVSILGFLITLSILERLLVNRWEIKPIIIAVTLIYLLYQLLSLLANELTYLFSSSIPDSTFNLVWYLLLIPAAVSLYLIRITHLNHRKGILIATLIASPFTILAVIQIPDIVSLFNDFSTVANYQNNLSPLNWHLSPTISIDDFTRQAADLAPGEFAD